MTQEIKHTPLPLQVGLQFKFKSMGDDQWNNWYIRRQSIDGSFYASQDKEFACGEYPVTEDEILSQHGLRWNTNYLLKQNEKGRQVAYANLKRKADLVPELESALLEALPFVEDALLVDGYKPTAVNAVIKRVRAAIAKAEAEVK